MCLRSHLAWAALLVSTSCYASDSATGSAEGFAFGTPLWVLGFAAVILFVFLLIPVSIVLTRFGAKPVSTSSDSGVELYSIPGWSMRSISADAMIVFTDETGWLGNGIGKYVKDKGDYQLDDKIRAAGPFAPGTAAAFPVKRLPVDHLIVANIYDERRMTNSEQFRKGFLAAADEASKIGCTTAMVFDPTEAWNYFTKRADVETVARLVGQAVQEAGGKLSTVKVVVTNPGHVEAYKRALA